MKKEQALRIVTECAERYEAELNNRNLLFICMDRHGRVSSMEVRFYPWNYLHMTGLKLSEVNSWRGKTSTPAQRFYEACVARKLTTADFEIPRDGLCELKLEILPYVIYKDLRANSVGKYNGKNPRLITEKLAGGYMACVGFVNDINTGDVVPNTLLNGNVKDFASDIKRIIAAFRKHVEDESYKEITHIAKKVDWAGITFPDPYEPLRQSILSITGNNSKP